MGSNTPSMITVDIVHTTHITLVIFGININVSIFILNLCPVRWKNCILFCVICCDAINIVLHIVFMYASAIVIRLLNNVLFFFLVNILFVGKKIIAGNSNWQDKR